MTSPGPNAANSAAAAAVASYSTAHSHITSMMGAGPGSPGLFQSSPSKFIDFLKFFDLSKGQLISKMSFWCF